MDAKDLFKQLTCGVNFAATKTNRKRTQPPIAEQQRPAVKKEKIEPLDSGDDDAVDADPFTASADDDDEDEDDKPLDIKMEETAADDGDEGGELQLFGSIVAANLKAKKPKQPPTEAKLKQLEQQRINEIRNRHQLHVTGSAVPEPLETFAALQQTFSLSEQLCSNLHACGYTTPTPIQMQAIPIMCAGHSLLACAPTGSGKTATFLVPIVRALKAPKQRGFRALVLCPTRELAKQTQRECLRLVETIGLRVHTLSKTNQAESRYGAKSGGRFDILVTTPQRVCHLLAQEPAALDLSNVKWLVLDEADKLFEEGTKSFREQFDQIHAACTHATRRVALFSATWTTPVARWLRKNTTGAMTVSVGQRNAATALVDQKLQFVGSEAGKLLAFRDLVRTGVQPPVLVFVDTKDRAEQLYRELIYDGINVDVIHADRTQQQRDEVVKAFREGKVWVLICTELIGRGIDFKGVNLVVNYDFPPSPIAYIHRIGRTGRAGRRGAAVTYFTQADTVHLKAIARIANASGCEVPKFMLAMKEHSKRAMNKLQREAKPREAISTRGKFGGGGKGIIKKGAAGAKKDKQKAESAVVKLKKPVTTKVLSMPRREKAQQKKKLQQQQQQTAKSPKRTKKTATK